MLEVTFLDCSPTNAVSLLTTGPKLRRFWAYRSDSKNFSKLLSLRNLQEIFGQSVGSISIQIYCHPQYTATYLLPPSIYCHKFTATLNILPQILANKQWRYSGICIWLFFRNCVILILTEEDYDFGGAFFVVSQTSFSSVPGCCHLHCCARVNSISFH
jgi:hypothetical protein